MWRHSSCRRPNSRATSCLSDYFESITETASIIEYFINFAVSYACSASYANFTWFVCFSCSQQSDGTFACCKSVVDVLQRTQMPRSSLGFLSATGCLWQRCLQLQLRPLSWQLLRSSPSGLQYWSVLLVSSRSTHSLILILGWRP